MDTSNKGDKPKVIASIDVNVYLPPTPKKTWLEESVMDHLTCVLCGNNLDFKHQTDFIAQSVSEEAHCPHCKIRSRKNTYSLQ